MIDRIRIALRHHLVRKTAVLQVGGVTGTIVQAIAGVLLARMLQPELFGRYALAFSVASISSVFIGGSLTNAIAPAMSRAWAQRDGRALRATIGFYLRFAAACALVTLVLLVALPFITGFLYHDHGIGGLAAVVVVASMVSVSVFALTQLVLQVAGRFRALAGLTLADVAVRYGMMLVLVATGFGVWGAVTGHLLGALLVLGVSVGLYLRLERTDAIVLPFRQFPELARRAAWRPLLAPTLWVLTDSNFALLYGALPVALVGLYVSGAELAYFKLAFGYIVLAMSALGPVSTVMNVHFPTVQTTAPERLRRTFVRVTFVSVALSAGVTVLAAALSPLVFRILYGEAYLPAIPYVFGFLPFGILFGLGIGLGPMWRALDRVRTSILINAIVLGVGVPLGLWLMHTWGLWGAVIMTSLWYTVSHVASFLYLGRILSNSEEISII